jgi:hypothetical protein
MGFKRVALVLMPTIAVAALADPWRRAKRLVHGRGRALRSDRSSWSRLVREAQPATARRTPCTAQ